MAEPPAAAMPGPDDQGDADDAEHQAEPLPRASGARRAPGGQDGGEDRLEADHHGRDAGRDAERDGVEDAAEVTGVQQQPDDRGPAVLRDGVAMPAERSASASSAEQRPGHEPGGRRGR